MENETVRTRFAPSPTGSLHLGNVRIAVFNCLFTRHHGGAFVLRIEDTDQERNEAGAEEGIMEDLRWLGLDWDEGPDVGGAFGPYRQSERTELYRRVALALLGKGRAYPCYCTDEELAAESEAVPGGEVLRYSGRCRGLSEEDRRELAGKGREAALRFAVPDVEHIEIHDVIRGAITFPAKDITDFVILRRDGRPTYNFAVVVDDADMEITHVIRGAGHLSNTPKQRLLFDAMGREAPSFAHLPTVLGPSGGKLSKRTGAAAVAELREQGFPPDAVVNYLSLLGWSHPEEREVLTRSELVAELDLDRVGASDTVLDPEKLRWMSGQHLARLDEKELVDGIKPFLDRSRYPLGDEQLTLALDALSTRLSTLSDINEHLTLIFPEEGPELDEERRSVARNPEARELLEVVRERLGKLAAWNAESLDAAVREAGAEVGARGRSLFHPLRKALTGVESGPDLGKVLACIGRSEAVDRIDTTLSTGASHDADV